MYIYLYNVLGYFYNVDLLTNIFSMSSHICCRYLMANTFLCKLFAQIYLKFCQIVSFPKFMFRHIRCIAIFYILPYCISYHMLYFVILYIMPFHKLCLVTFVYFHKICLVICYVSPYYLSY